MNNHDMTKREATRRLRELCKEEDKLGQACADIRDAKQKLAIEYSGINPGDEVEVKNPGFRYTKGIVICVSGGDYQNPSYFHFGTVTIQPWCNKGHGKRLTRSHDARRHFSKDGILRVTRTAAQVGPFAALPRTTP